MDCKLEAKWSEFTQAIICGQRSLAVPMHAHISQAYPYGMKRVVVSLFKGSLLMIKILPLTLTRRHLSEDGRSHSSNSIVAPQMFVELMSILMP
jgi:hypothetical protein